MPNSACIGKTTAELQFRTKYGLNVVGIKRDGVVLSDAFKEKYRSGDLLLVIGDLFKRCVIVEKISWC